MAGDIKETIAVGNYFVPSENAAELFVFSPSNRHVRTLDAITGVVLHQFGYDGAGRLTGITDRDGNVTTIERDAQGIATAIVGPYGQRTSLAMDTNGYLATVTNPAGEAHRATYTAEGLLTEFIPPKGNVSPLTYDSLGRLTRDTDAAGGFKALARTQAQRSYAVTLASALGRTTLYEVEALTTGNELRATTAPDGTLTETVIGIDGRRTTTFADGTVATSVAGPDPRFSMQAPLTKSLTLSTGGLSAGLTMTRAVSLASPGDLMSLSSLTDTITINGRPYVTAYAASTRTLTESTPAGRQRVTTLDALGRPIRTQLGGLEAANLTYDGRGRLSTLVAGSGSSARTYAYVYDSAGLLATITDPLGRVETFAYDAAGRVTTQTLPDGRPVRYAYDANGNVTSITPPGRPAHGFAYTPVDRTSTYVPPNVGAGTNETRYIYDADRQLAQVNRPDGQSVTIAYDGAGRPSTLALPAGQGQQGYAYDAATGKPIAITGPDGSTLSYAYNGALLTQSIWSGAVTGNVGRTYDNNFRLAALAVNGANPITYTYDADSLPTQVGAMLLSRRADNGLLAGSSIGAVTDSRTYNGFGETSRYAARVNATEVFTIQYTRDALGRITGKSETVEGATDNYEYGYDVAGRLATVKTNGAVTATYTYDSNGNRLSGPGLTTAPTYDDQDRLISYGGTTFSYTANGELATKTTGASVTTYSYDALGNLRRVVHPDGRQIDYVVDSTGRRIGKKIDGALVQGLLYQDGLKPIAELDGANNVVSRFVYATRVNVPDYMIKGGATYRIVTDHLGSPRLVISTATGSIAQRMDYDEWGNVASDDNPGFQPFGFAGGLYDLDSKLTRFGARDYDAERGRWTAKDPIRFIGGDANLYGYIERDPVNWADAFGLDGDSADCPDGRGYLPRAWDRFRDYLRRQRDRAVEAAGRLSDAVWDCLGLAGAEGAARCFSALPLPGGSSGTRLLRESDQLVGPNSTQEQYRDRFNRMYQETEGYERH